MKKSYLAADSLIAIAKVDESKIYIREQNGRYQRMRRYLSWILMVVFIFLPLLRYRGEQAILFDIWQQTLQIFSLTLFPQDLFIFSLVFILAAFSLFYLARLYGRVWCGFSCPQTIWMLMFNWLERRIEGSANQSRHLDKSALTSGKLFKKIQKHMLWLAVSLLTALVFMSYFVPVEELYSTFFAFESSSLVVSWVIFFTLCTYINAGWIREKMCIHMCPYSRFQSAMFNSQTKLVSYDELRGESRGKRKRNQDKAAGMGDCVDCNLCVEVCPAGIDIRDGLQYECINCGLCIDACDQTMEKFNYAKGLISFAQKQANNGWRQHIAYGGIIAVFILLMCGWAASWQNFEVNIIRDRNALYRVNSEGNVENSYLVKIRNKSNQQQTMSIELDEIGIQLLGEYRVKLAPRELKIVPVVAILTEQFNERRKDISIEVHTRSEKIVKPVSFYAGSDVW